MRPKTHIVASSSTNSDQHTIAPTRKGFVNKCACTEPAGTGKRGEQNVVTHTLLDKNGNKAPYTRTIRYEEPFLLGKQRLALRSPALHHYDQFVLR